MTSNIAQDDTQYRQESLHGKDNLIKGWPDHAQLRKEIEIAQEKAKKEAIDKITKIFSQKKEEETLQKLEKICDLLICDVVTHFNAVSGNVEEEYREPISN